MPLLDGARFAGFTIRRRLGAGGMGEVYLAEHPRLPRSDALKILPADVSADPQYRARFIREADLAAGLWHPHIVSVHDRGEFHGQLWLSMDYVAGADAGHLLSSHYPDGMPIDLVEQIVAAVAAALDYAHDRGLLHRDVKPANIMISEPGGAGERRIMLTDFGIARRIEDTADLTATNIALGTVAYCAPEQLLGQQLDSRADQYALAATAFHLLTGRQMFANSNPTVVISHHLTSSPPTLAATHPRLAPLDPVLAVALAKDPRDRFPTATAFARALADALPHAAADAPANAPTRARPALALPPAALPSPRPGATTVSRVAAPPTEGRRHRLPAVAATIAVAVVVLGALLVAKPWAGGNPADSSARSTSGSTPAAALDPANPSVVPPSSTTTTTATTTTTTTTSTTTATTSAAAAVSNVDPDDYADAANPGYYRWVYARTPYYRDCRLFPLAMGSTEPEGLSCSVAFPPGTPEVSNPPFHGPPNEIRIILPDGPTPAIGEGGLDDAKTLLPNQRITIGAFSCTGLPGGGIDCAAPTGGFRFDDGVLTQRGPG